MEQPQVNQASEFIESKIKQFDDKFVKVNQRFDQLIRENKENIRINTGRIDAIENQKLSITSLPDYLPTEEQ